MLVTLEGLLEDYGPGLKKNPHKHTKPTVKYFPQEWETNLFQMIADGGASHGLSWLEGCVHRSVHTPLMEFSRACPYPQTPHEALYSSPL